MINVGKKTLHIFINNFILLSNYLKFLSNSINLRNWTNFSISYTQQPWLIQLRNKIWNMKNANGIICLFKQILESEN